MCVGLLLLFGAESRTAFDYLCMLPAEMFAAGWSDGTVRS
jgi:hypothetical protein